MFNSNLSKWGSVTIGVPQGSILGPLLFALYINDLPSVVSHSILDLYADDAELHFSHPDLNVVQTQLQLDLNAVAQWINSSRLCLNVVKSNAMLIGSQQRLSGKALTFQLVVQFESARYCTENSIAATVFVHDCIEFKLVVLYCALLKQCFA